MPSGSVTPAGGAAFNGGTITLPQTIDVGSRAAAGGLEITGTSGANVKRLGVDFGHQALSLTGDGVLDISSDDTMSVSIHGTGGSSPAEFDVYDDRASGTEFRVDTANSFLYKDNGAGGATVFQVATDGTGKGKVRRYPAAPLTAALVSGTGSQIDTSADRETYTPVTFNPTAGAAATCAVAVSPDNVTYTALWTETEPAGIAFDGTIHGIRVFVPGAWYLKLTVVNATIGTTTYY